MKARDEFESGAPIPGSTRGADGKIVISIVLLC
jgi:hypothetical protein